MPPETQALNGLDVLLLAVTVLWFVVRRRWLR